MPGPSLPAPRTLTPELAAAERTYRTMLFETFAFELRLGHRLGFVRAFASPRIAGLLAATGEIEHDTSRRGTDTGLFMYSILHHGLDSETGRRAVDRINEMHAGHAIRDDDYRWILSTWVLPGLRIVDRFGWRRPTDAERAAVVAWHRELGLRMGVTGVPGDVAGLEAMARTYERDTLRPSAAGHALLSRATAVAVRSVPRALRPAALRAVAVLIDEPARSALGLAAPGHGARVLVPTVLHAHAVLRRVKRRLRGPAGSWFVPGAPRRDYPEGYTIEDLGPSASRAPKPHA